MFVSQAAAEDTFKPVQRHNPGQFSCHRRKRTLGEEEGGHRCTPEGEKSNESVFAKDLSALSKLTTWDDTNRGEAAHDKVTAR